MYFYISFMNTNLNEFTCSTPHLQYYNNIKKQCESCPTGAYCPIGGSRIWPKFQYWSKKENNIPMKCLIRESCPGSYGFERYNVYYNELNHNFISLIEEEDI